MLYSIVVFLPLLPTRQTYTHTVGSHSSAVERLLHAEGPGFDTQWLLFLFYISLFYTSSFSLHLSLFPFFCHLLLLPCLLCLLLLFPPSPCSLSSVLLLFLHCSPALLCSTLLIDWCHPFVDLVSLLACHLILLLLCSLLSSASYCCFVFSLLSLPVCTYLFCLTITNYVVLLLSFCLVLQSLMLPSSTHMCNRASYQLMPLVATEELESTRWQIDRLSMTSNIHAE